MTDKNIQKLIDKYLEGATSPAEERQLAQELLRPDIPEEWQTIRLMLGELTMGEAQYDSIMAQHKQRPSAILIAIVTPSIILEAVSKYYNVTSSDITSKKRNAEIVLPRQIFMYLCRNMTDTTLQGIATLLDKKDHSTVLHGCKKIEDEIKINQELRETIDLIKNNIIAS